MKKSKFAATPSQSTSKATDASSKSLATSTITNRGHSQNSSLWMPGAPQISHEVQPKLVEKHLSNKLPPSVSAMSKLRSKQVPQKPTGGLDLKIKEMHASTISNKIHSEKNQPQSPPTLDLSIADQEILISKPKERTASNQKEANSVRVQNDIGTKSPFKTSFQGNLTSTTKKHKPQSSFYNSQTEKKKKQASLTQQEVLSQNTSKGPEMSIVPLTFGEDEPDQMFFFGESKQSSQRLDVLSTVNKSQINDNTYEDNNKPQQTSPVRSVESNCSLLAENNGRDKEISKISHSPKSADQYQQYLHHHKRVMSKFSSKRTDHNLNDPHVLFEDSDSHSQNNDATKTPQHSQTNMQRMRTDQLAIECYRGIIDNFSQHSQSNLILKSIDDTDRLIYQENSKKMKVERKLRSVEEENLKLRGMINYLLNIELQQQA